MREGWLQFVSSAQASDPAFVSRQLPRARAMMEFYFAHRSVGQHGLTPLARKRLLAACYEWPWICITAPRRIAGLFLAIMKSRTTNIQLQSVETPRHV
jgi:hypothetical protein